MKKIIIYNFGMIITNKCNLDCKHCMRGEKCNNSMSDDVIEATLSQIAGIENLCICGGEPTLAVDVMKKIFNYIIEHKIYVQQVTTTINGTIFSLEFLECLDMIENYIIKYLPNRKEISSFDISNDKYHQEEIHRLKLDLEFLQNVEKYKKSKYYIGYRDLDPELKLFREGNAKNLDKNLTVPLRSFPPYITHIGKRVFGNFYLEDKENGLVNIGTIVTVNCDGTITECDASIIHQNTIYNYGNVLSDNIYDVCLKIGKVVKPYQFTRALNKQKREILTYND